MTNPFGRRPILIIIIIIIVSDTYYYFIAVDRQPPRATYTSRVHIGRTRTPLHLDVIAVDTLVLRLVVSSPRPAFVPRTVFIIYVA
jgi:hypothetical protein